MLKVKARWSGFNGSPGWTNFFFRDFSAGPMDQAMADAAAAKMTAYFSTVKAQLPVVVKVRVQSDVEVIEETTGALQSIFTVPAQAEQTGTAAGGTYAGPVGAVTNWRTGGVRNGRRVRGRTFLVPAASNVFDGDGTLTAVALANLQTAALNLTDGTGAADFGVYARPSAPGASDGVWYVATSYTVADMAAVLRSRRD